MVLRYPMIPGSLYIQFIEDCYKQNLLINNEMKIDSQTIDLRKIRCPLLNILAKYDHIVPLSSGKALKDVYSGKDYEEIVFPSSHTGLSVSRKPIRTSGLKYVNGWIIVKNQ